MPKTLELKDITEALRLNRVEIRNLPIQEYAKFLIQNKIGINDFLFDVPTYTLKQPYFMGHTFDLYDTVYRILLEENEVLTERYRKCKEYPR